MKIAIFLLCIQFTVILIHPVVFIRIEGNTASTSIESGFVMDMHLSEVSDINFHGDSANSMANSGSLIGDVNGDGLADLIIGARGNGDTGKPGCEVHLFFGKPQKLNGNISNSESDVTFIGEHPEDQAGYHVSWLGDINCDGLDDILIGAHMNDEILTNSGRAYIFFGKTQSWSKNISLKDADVIINGRVSQNIFGLWFTGLGDINNDGKDDFAIDALGNDEGGKEAGKVYIYFGKENWNSTMYADECDASIIGVDHDALGLPSKAGDLNGDGLNDLMVSAFRNDEAGSRSGKLYILFGKETNWSKSLSVQDTDASYLGINSNDQIGRAGTASGDLNGDGLDDIAVVLQEDDVADKNGGEVVIIFGRRNNWTHNVSLTNADASFLGENPGDSFNNFILQQVFISEDISGDGMDDLIICRPNNDEGGLDVGQVYLVFGKKSGWEMDVELSDSNASIIGSINDGLINLGGGGDFDGDGLNDLLIGSLDRSNQYRGRIFLVSPFFCSEPVEIYTISAYADSEFTISGTIFDIGEKVYIEITGMDRYPNSVDIAKVNLTSFKQNKNINRGFLYETGSNTGIYRGELIIPYHAEYFDNPKIVSWKDPLKHIKIKIDHIHRPSLVTNLNVFRDKNYGLYWDKFDIDDIAYLEVIGIDTDPSNENIAIVNATCDSYTLRNPMAILQETDTNSGRFRGEFKIPSTIEYLENITFYSSKSVTITNIITVHTPLQIRPLEIDSNIEEDEKLILNFTNFGYEDAIWEVNHHAGWLNWDVMNHSLFGIPRNNHVGSWDVQIKIQDQYGHKNVRDIKLMVNNTPPRITTSNHVIATENREYHVDYNCSDDGQGSIKWFINPYNGWLKIDIDNGTVYGYPRSNDIGTHFISIRVEDGNGGFDSTSFALTVNKLNRPPSISDFNLVNGIQDQKFYLDLDATDPDGETELVWFLETNAAFLWIDKFSGELQGTPGPFDIGSWELNISVVDEGGLSDKVSIELFIENINDIPIWKMVPESVEIEHGSTYQFKVEAIDPDPGDSIIYSIFTVPDVNMKIDMNEGSILWKADYSQADENGNINVFVKASDKHGYSIYNFSLQITISDSLVTTLLSPENGIIISIVDTVLSWESNLGAETSYLVYLHEKSEFVMDFNDAAIYESDFKFNSIELKDVIPGKMYYWTVIPHEGNVTGICRNGIRSFIINIPPTIQIIPNQSIKVGEVFQYRIITDVYDSNVTTLIYILNNQPEGMEISRYDGLISWKPKQNQIGKFEITIRVSDGIDQSDTTLNLEVLQNNDTNQIQFRTVILIVVLIIVILSAIFLYQMIKYRKITGLKDEE